MKLRTSVLALAMLAIAGSASATVCNLTLINSRCVINGAIFANPDNLTNIGSGQILPFLTTQRNDTESGFSTDVSGSANLPLDDKRDNANTFTNTLTRANVGTQQDQGIDYVAFFLDVNEPANDDSLISLDSFVIYGTGASSPFTTPKTETLAQLDTLLGGNLIYRLGVGNSILLDANIFKGSGIGVDMIALIPVVDFTGPQDNRFVVATQFGQAGGFAGTADGFEEWYALKGAVPPPPPPGVPEPGVVMLIGAALLGAFIQRKRA